MTQEHHTARALPPLPLDEWEDTKETLHRYCQIVGKVRMELSPFRNHWWHVTLYVTTRGLSTGPIPYGPHDSATFDISFDLLENKLAVITSDEGEFSFALDDLPVAEFYRRLFDGLRSLGIDAAINTKPFSLDDEFTLDENTFHCVCDREYARRYHRILLWVDQVFKQFSGRFNGKTSPVQFFWHSFDLAVTRFSEKQAPLPENTDSVTREAYSHEVISFGFWPGDQNVQPREGGRAPQGDLVVVAPSECGAAVDCSWRGTGRHRAQPQAFGFHSQRAASPRAAPRGG